jgi:hypothetical protein
MMLPLEIKFNFVGSLYESRFFDSAHILYLPPSSSLKVYLYSFLGGIVMAFLFACGGYIKSIF